MKTAAGRGDQDQARLFLLSFSMLKKKGKRGLESWTSYSSSISPLDAVPKEKTAASRRRDPSVIEKRRMGRLLLEYSFEIIFKREIE